MEVRPVPLSDGIKAQIEPSLRQSAWDWPEIEKWLADHVACVWAIGSNAWAITAANEDDEIDVIVAGGSGARDATRPFISAMLSLPEHKGKTLRIEGRRGWQRFCENWHCEEVGGGDVILTKRV